MAKTMTRAEDAERRERRLQREAEGRELARGPIDMPFLLLVLLLTGIGLVMLFSASFPRAYYKGLNPAYFLIRQGVFATAGIALMLGIGKINYQRFRGASRFLLGVSIILLAMVLIPGIGQTRNNATRWIGVGELFTFQPSEIAKFAVVLYFSDTISKKKDKMRTFRYGILPYAFWMVVIAALMMLEPHLSGTVLILGVGAILMLVGGIRWIWVFAALGVAGAAGYLIVGVLGYGSSRIAMWHDPWIDPLKDGYQMVQSLLSIGSGGLLGVGLGKSRQKFLYLPEEHNDFIFSIVCEELGLIGACVIMLLFAALILRGYWIALHARDRFGALLVVGVTSLIAMQTFLNIGVVTGLLPATGISLPFFSYGGTALLIQLAEMGVVLSVSRQMKPTKNG
ncbi:MAG: putative lipid II flippase FtsW [Dysosmobacter sp.]|nr:putative lipid II flippase FtsW [Dysosmobacter sp.]MDY3281061.1 putative lipid II flippase FtsW [Dysosmobacter sp.]